MQKWVNVDDIVYFSSESHETVIHTRNGDELFCSLSLTKLEQRLTEVRFFRIHRSYLVNIAAVSGVSANRSEVLAGEGSAQTLPLSRRAKTRFLSLFESLHYE